MERMKEIFCKGIAHMRTSGVFNIQLFKLSFISSNILCTAKILSCFASKHLGMVVHVIYLKTMFREVSIKKMLDYKLSVVKLTTGL